AYQAALDAGYMHRAANILLSLAGTYHNMERYPKAISLLQKSKTLQDDLEDTQMKMNTLEQLSHSYAALGDFQNAFDFFTQFKSLQDSLQSEQNLHDVQELEKKYKTQQQSAQIQLQQVELRQQRGRLIAVSLLALLLLSIVFLVWRSSRERQRNNEQLRQLDRAKSRFFANSSHELRTPLTLILAPLESAIDKVKSTATKDQLKLAHNNGKKLLTLVNEILDLSKLESGKMTLQESPVYLEKLLRRIFFSYHSLAQLRGFILSFSYHLPEDLAIKVDIGKFEKVVNNLLSNAIKYSQSGGVITLRAGREGTFLKIEVTDTGKGIAPEQLDRIFDRFYQVEGEHEPLQGGTGIGLAYAKEIAHFFGGDLQVKSQLGKGSTFIFTLPLKKADRYLIPPLASIDPTMEEEQRAIWPSPSRPPLAQKGHILIVEDNPEMSRFLFQSLSAYFQCSVAMDGVQALQMLQEGLQPDLITSDVMM
ncbi:MAG: ATP-binding protein, partial [Bacteroidota bacterium]